MDRIIGANTIDLGGGRQGFRGKDTVAGIPGTELTATWHNDVQEEIVGLIEEADFVPSANDRTQLTRAVRSQRVNWLIAGGTANAITLTPTPAFTALAELVGVPLRFLAAASNTGPVTLDVSGLGAIPVVWNDGSTLISDTILVGLPIDVIYDGTRFVVLAGPSKPALAPRLPLFFVARAAAPTTVVADVWTKLSLGTEVVDTGGVFNPATGRFLPNRAGYYAMWGVCTFGSNTDNPTTGVRIYQNGVVLNSGLPSTIFGSQFGCSKNGSVAVCSGVSYFNGSTDYAELFGYKSTHTATPDYTANNGFMAGHYLGVGA